MAYGAALRTVTLSLDTNAYADGDVMADTQELTGAMRQKAGRCVLNSIHVLDKDDVGQAFDIVLLKSNTSIGTEGDPANLSDSVADEILAIGGANNDLRIAAADYTDVGGSKIATKHGIGLVLEAADTRNLWVATIIRGAGTYTASGVKITFGFLWD